MRWDCRSRSSRTWRRCRWDLTNPHRRRPTTSPRPSRSPRLTARKWPTTTRFASLFPLSRLLCLSPSLLTFALGARMKCEFLLSFSVRIIFWSRPGIDRWRDLWVSSLQISMTDWVRAVFSIGCRSGELVACLVSFSHIHLGSRSCDSCIGSVLRRCICLFIFVDCALMISSSDPCYSSGLESPSARFVRTSGADLKYQSL